MPRRYTVEEKQNALRQLAENGGDLALTSARTGIPKSTLSGWKRRHRAQPSAQPRAGASDSDGAEVTTLRALQRQMLAEAQRLVRSIESAIDDAPLNQRVAALAQLIDRSIKLATQLPSEPHEMIIRFEYEDPEDDPARPAPLESAEDHPQ